MSGGGVLWSADPVRTHDFGERIAHFRVPTGCASRDSGTLSAIETGKSNPPSAKMIRKFAAVLGQDPKPLLTMGFLEKAPPEIRDELLELAFGMGAGTRGGKREGHGRA